MKTDAAPPPRLPLRGILIDLAMLAGVGTVLALIGPFGTFRDPFAFRLVMWIGFALVGYLLYSPIDSVARRLAPQLALPVWALRVAGVLLASAPMAVLVWFAPRWNGDPSWPGLEIALVHYFHVAIVGFLITATMTLLQRRSGSEAETRDPAVPPALSSAPAIAAVPRAVPQAAPRIVPEPAARFFDRLPPALGSDLLALEMEDHYVRAHTALGSDLVLMRLRDAVAELGDIDGLQVHRSWWVARHAVSDVRRDGRNVRLLLDTGLEAPVSRANVQMLRDAGWF